MIKALIFDTGGVLHADESKIIHAEIMSEFGLAKEKFKYAWRRLIPRLNRGEMPEKNFWQLFIKLSHSTASIPKESPLLSAFVKHYKIDSNMIETVKSLKKQGYKLAVLSNTCKPHTDYNKKAGLYDEFSVLVLSNEVGMKKPEPRIYKLALEKLNTRPDESVFIDDMEEYVKAAQELGIKASFLRTLGC